MEVERICPHCMGEMPEGEKKFCPWCGYDFGNPGEVTHQLKPFTILAGKYLVGDVLGEGGFGITYIGFDLNLEIKIAIKEFYPNGFATRESQNTSELTAYAGQSMETVYKWRDNFVKEARSLAKCSHLPGIVGVKDYFQENNTAYIIMEYLEGQTLKENMKANGGKIPPDDVLRMMRPVISSLEEVHREGLIHRDISPDNLILLKGGNVKLLDFGAARDYTESGEKSLSVMLKPGYAPEEQYRTKGKQGPWSDVYALSATIYKCITGVTPPEAMERMRTDELKKISSLGILVSPQVETALEKGMAVFAENRCQSMEELEKMLYNGVVMPDVNTAAAAQPVPQEEKAKDYRKAVPVAAGIAVLLLIVVAVSSGKNTKETEGMAEAGAVKNDVQSVVDEQAKEELPDENAPSQEESPAVQGEAQTKASSFPEADSLLTAFQSGLNTVSLDGVQCAYTSFGNNMWYTTGLAGIQGTLASFVRDIDGDGVNELVTVDISDNVEGNHLGDPPKDVSVSVYEAVDGQVVPVSTETVFDSMWGDYWWFHVFYKDGMLALNSFESGQRITADGMAYRMDVLSYDGNGLLKQVDVDFDGSDDVDTAYYESEIDELYNLGFYNTCNWMRSYQDLQFVEEEGMEQIYVAETQNKYWDYMWYYGWDSQLGSNDVILINEDKGSGQVASGGLTVDARCRADYGLALDPSQYQVYNGTASFYYPVNLYNHVSVDIHPFSFALGTNQETVVFRGRNNGNQISNMLFATYTWDSGLDIKSQNDFICGYMAGTMTDPEIILNSCDETTVTESGVPYGKLVMTGYASAEHDYMLYVLVRFEPGKTQVMRIVAPVIPGDKTSIDYQQKAYFIENMYRMCGFSGASKGVRTFDQYIRGEDL